MMVKKERKKKMTKCPTWLRILKKQLLNKCSSDNDSTSLVVKIVKKALASFWVE